MVEQERQIGKRRVEEKQVMEKVMAMVERKIEEEKKKMVTFVAGVINATSDVKSKTERIQIIVKAACHSLDMKNIRGKTAKDSGRAATRPRTLLLHQAQDPPAATRPRILQQLLGPGPSCSTRPRIHQQPPGPGSTSSHQAQDPPAAARPRALLLHQA
ncbi:palmitoyltransferase ZDHHC5/8 [Sarotherodon galilaeus]